ncbi:hypothetical protein MY10362_002202 [Beauveria mimosiformis]
MESREGTDSSAPPAQRTEGYETAPSEAATPPASKQQSRRSRVQRTVTINACNECRRKRAKQRKVDLVLAGLNQPRVQDEVLARLQALQPLDGIAGWLRRTEQQPHQQQQYEASANGVTGYVNNHFSQLLPSSTANIHGGLGVGDRADSTLKPSVQRNVATPSQAHHERSFLLDESSRYPDALPEPARSRVANWSETRQTNHIIGSPGEHPELSEAVSSLQESLIKQSTETWTTVTNDVELVKHILGLYFCWEYPTFASLSKEQFLRDFSQGRPRYCCSMLVNALLALGCHFSTFPKTRADPDDPQTSGQHFFDESLELLRRETDYHSLLMIQTLGILSIREASCGHTAEIENPQDAGVTDEFTVLSATYWGAFSLDQNFATWFDNVPTAFRLGYNFTPAVLFSQRTPTFLPHFILTSSITLLIIGVLSARPDPNGSGTKVDPGIVDDVKLGMDSLEEIAPCHHFAEQAVNVLRCLAVKWNVHTSIGPLPVITPDTYDRLVEPYFGRQSLFADDRLARSFVIGDEMRQVSEEESQQIKEAIIMMETLILQPVPVQGPSAFLRETKLAEHGFIKI